MQKCVCDICGIDEPQHNWKIKEKRLYQSGDKIPLISWDRMDICDKCFNTLARLRYEQELEKRVTDICFNKYVDLYPDNIDMQSAYLQGVQDVLDIFIQNKIIVQK